VKDLHIKKPGGWFWTPLSRDELDQRIGAGLIKRDWKIWRDGESDIITVAEFLDRTEQRSTDSQGIDQGVDANPRSIGGGSGRVTFVLLSTYIICSFLWRALSTAHEYPMRFEQVFTIMWDLLGVIVLIALKIHMLKKTPPNQPEWITGEILFWIALFAAVGRLLIRLNSDASWWTGHLFYEI
jgi:hypothetical protein